MQVNRIGIGLNRPNFKRDLIDTENKGQTKPVLEECVFNYLNFTSNRILANQKTIMLSPLQKHEEELRYSGIAREIGVNTPPINSNREYIITGKQADVKRNPITDVHIENVLSDILLMDKAGLMHGDIEQAHVFYSKNGDVEFDFFRHGYLINEDEERRNWDFPKTEYPTNIRQYENNSIGCYIDSMDNEKRNEFIKGYMNIAADFHNERARFLEEKGKGTKEQIEYEKLQGKFLKNPDEDVVELFKQRIELDYNQRKYFTEWDEGTGNSGDEPDEDRMVASIFMHYDSIRSGIQYYNQIDFAQKNCNSEEKARYFEYEKEYAKHFTMRRAEGVAGMAPYVFKNNNPANKTHKNMPQSELQKLITASDELKAAPFEEKIEKTAEAEKAYDKLLTL